MIQIIKYGEKYKKEWNDFIERSKNGTFLFNRNYMDYHSDRFEDHSLLFYSDNKLLALLPANIKENILVSHGGLTYGGLVITDKIGTSKTLQIFDELINYSTKNNFSEIIYKTIPHIYHKIPAEEELYALFRNNTVLSRRDASSTILLKNYKIGSNRMNGARKAENENVKIAESDDFEGFFGMVNEVLNSKYEVNAVHTFKEMEMLKNRFPKNIRFFAAFKENVMLGGAVIYETDTVAHAQYLASNDLGKSLRVLDLLIFSLLENYKQSKIWFDFGISTEQNGSYLNENLIKQKEEFGASCVTYDTYKIKLNGNG